LNGYVVSSNTFIHFKNSIVFFSQHVADLTQELNVVRAGLIQATADEQESDQFPYTRDSGLLSTAELEHVVISCLANHQFSPALLCAKQYRLRLEFSLNLRQTLLYICFVFCKELSYIASSQCLIGTQSVRRKSCLNDK